MKPIYEVYVPEQRKWCGHQHRSLNTACRCAMRTTMVPPDYPRSVICRDDGQKEIWFDYMGSRTKDPFR